MSVYDQANTSWYLVCSCMSADPSWGRLLAILSIRGSSSEPRLSDSSVDALTRWEIASSRSNASRAWRNSAIVVGSGSA